ncbi:hypothetical protein AMTR_s00019p00059140 [Amborella trichopoda]|uniref:Uncharacterized protein n=1 Tax=Amborella trichopoda TaxID=13333 RepID=W1PH99_AMBTC|nr:hypothetical protein AMTR_s00019p00059140 [Amborella trichopoda]
MARRLSRWINIHFKEEAHVKVRSESIGRTRVGEEPLWLHECAIRTSFDELQTIDDLGRIMSNRFRDIHESRCFLGDIMPLLRSLIWKELEGITPDLLPRINVSKV